MSYPTLLLGMTCWTCTCAHFEYWALQAVTHNRCSICAVTLRVAFLLSFEAPDLWLLDALLLDLWQWQCLRTSQSNLARRQCAARMCILICHEC